jgi:Cu(I)/Ag(I) efflux system membrane fusion protein
MAELYSPELIVAQRELLQARRLEEKFQGEDPSFGKTTLENAREKLRLLGVQPHQIESLLERGTPSETLTIYAPQSGIVIDKLAKEGQYVDEGTVIYNLADLSVVWVYLDAYESDIAWLRYGQKVELTTKSYPGKIIEGRIAFIKPMLNDPTRTVRVRVNVPNEKGWLKPGMFVQAVVESRLDAHGDVYDPTLVGKWISPMHPEIVKDGPGKCDVCGMDLVPASSLGYSVPEKRPPKPLLIPDTAPLLTGKRAVVYVEVPDQDTPTYQGREVTLGPRANDRFIVETGLEEGEHVVTNGSFKLDSELQIRARPSMMTLEEEALPPMPELRVDASFLEQLRPLVSDYIDLQEALASDDLAASKKAAEQFHDTFGKVEGEGLLTGEPLLAWRDVRAMLRGALEVEFTEMSMAELRQKFETLSFAMIELVEVFGNPLEEPLREAYCPMAFNNQGAPWLQVREEIFNSYFGSQMLKCGEIRQTFPPFATSRDSKRREER